MSFRGRPSLSGTPGRSSLQPTPAVVDLAQLRLLLLSTRELPCFHTRPECQAMIDDVLTSCLPVAAMAGSTAGVGAGAGASAAAESAPPPSDASGLPLPTTQSNSDMSVEGVVWDTPASNPNPKHLQVGTQACAVRHLGKGGTTSSGTPTGKGGSSWWRRGGSPAAEKISITRIPDRAWTIALDYLELGEGMRCRQLGRVFRDTVEASLSVLALSGVNSITWATPENLLFLTRFKNVRTLHWYVGVGMPSKEEDRGAGSSESQALVGGAAAGDSGLGGLVAAAAAAATAAGDRFGAAAGESLLRHADCSPVRAWAYLLGALPKIEEVIIVEGAETNELLLEEVWLHLLPLCRNLRSFFLNFEDYSQCPLDGDHPPINVKKFAVFLQAKKPFPKLRELHLELGSMSIAEQRSLIRGLSMSGLLPQLEKVTLGDGTTSYVRSTGKGPGRDLYAAFKKSPCARLKVLWLQRLDLWDDLESLALALGPAYCPVLEELFLDLALDTDDVVRLAKCLHKFPECLKTLGVLAVAIKGRTQEGIFDIIDPTPALQKLATALAQHPRPKLQCLDISLHYEPFPADDPGGALEEPKFQARMATRPIMSLLSSGVLSGLKHVQMSSCSLDDKGLLAACQSVASMKGIQTLDLSTNQLSKAGATAVAKALWRCRSLHEIVLEDSVDLEDSAEVESIFKEFMPWAIVRVEDRDTRRRNLTRPSALAELGVFDADAEDQGGLGDEDAGGDGDDGDVDEGEPLHWDASDAGSDGEVPHELMVDDSDEDM